MMHTVKGFGIVNKVEVDVFLELSCFLYDRTGVGNLISDCVPALLFDLRPDYGGGDEDNVTSFRRSPARTAALSPGHR